MFVCGAAIAMVAKCHRCCAPRSMPIVMFVSVPMLRNDLQEKLLKRKRQNKQKGYYQKPKRQNKRKSIGLHEKLQRQRRQNKQKR